MHICDTCGKIGGHGRGICPNRLSVPERKEQKAAALREKAERIAAETLRLHYGPDAPNVDDARPLQIDPSDLVALIEAAALAALTEKETAK